MSKISLIVAMSENRVIGRNGQMPWRMSADLRRFKSLTMGHHLIMGRKTFESIGRTLPGRQSIVVTRQRGYSAPGVLVAHDLHKALRLAAGDEEVFIIGGAEIYRQALSLVDRIYLTMVRATLDGDAYFVELNYADWQLVDYQDYSADEKNEFDYSFRTFDRLPTRPAPLPRKELPSMPDNAATIQELLGLTQQLLNCIASGDWQMYLTLCDSSLTCFEPEARGQLVEGLQFHQFYFELGGAPARRQVTITQPHVRLLGDDAAVVNYVRLTQSADANGNASTSRFEETRVWQRRGGQWKHVHFHRSANT